MSFPYYVAPEQLIHDKADYARKGIAQGKSIVAIEYIDGIMMVAVNPSTYLNKVSEIYDQIAFAGVGKYSEFENLRKAGIRYADLKGYAYSREDVTIKSLANAYSETVGTVFVRDIKPLEVEILVMEVGDGDKGNVIYRIQFDGSISDHKNFAVIGGQADRIEAFLKNNYQPHLPSDDALKLSVKGLETAEDNGIIPDNLEVAVLDRNRQGRKFRRFTQQEIASVLADTE
jgi:proteasome alpha subunit